MAGSTPGELAVGHRENPAPRLSWGARVGAPISVLLGPDPKLVEPLLRCTHAVSPRLVFFYSPTCGASRRTEALLGHVLQHNRNHNTFVVHRVNVSERPDLADRFAVEQTPAVRVVVGKRVVARGDRPRTVSELQGILGPWLRQTNGDAVKSTAAGNPDL